MFKKFKEGSKACKACGIAKKVLKWLLGIIALWFTYQAFVAIPAQEIKNKYYVDVIAQDENGQQIQRNVKITEARTLCHFDSIRQAEEIASTEELPEDFNINAFYETQYVICLRAIGLQL